MSVFRHGTYNSKSTGRIVGWNDDTGTVKGCVVVNYDINGFRDYVGRVIGKNEGAALDNLAEPTFPCNSINGVDGFAVSMADLKKQATYTTTVHDPGANQFSLGWDFTNVWQISEDNGHPTLKVMPED